MEKKNVSSDSISIINPSQLVLNIDDYLRLSKRLPSQDETLHQKEEAIFNQLGERKQQSYPKLLMFEINLQKITDQINEKFQDGIDLEEEMVRYQSDRTIRRKPAILDDPSIVRELSTSKITSIRVGKHTTLGDNFVSLKRFNTSLLAFAYNYETTPRTR